MFIEGITCVNTLFSFHYFAVLYLQESQTGNIKLEEITAHALGKILKSIYSNKLVVDTNDVEEVLSASHRLQTKAVTGICEKFLSQRPCMNVGNCLLCMELGEKFDLEDLYTRADQIFLENFVEVSKTQDRFLKFDVNALCQYLSNDKLCGEEDGIFKAAIRWIKHDPSRTGDAARVLGNIRFPKMSADALKSASEMKIIQENKTCKALVKSALKYHKEIYTQPFKNGPQYESRG